MGFRGTSNAPLDDIFACAEYFASGGRFSFGVWALDNVGASCGANPSRECKRELVVLRKTIVDAAGSVSRPMGFLPNSASSSKRHFRSLRKFVLVSRKRMSALSILLRPARTRPRNKDAPSLPLS